MRKGKRWTALLLALVLCLSVLPAGVLASEAGAAEAVSPSVMAVTSGKCGKNLTWKLDSKGTLTISGKGAMYDYFAVAAPWEPQILKIKAIDIKEGVTKIGAGAFGGCSVKQLKIPNSVTSIGESAFSELGGIKTIKLPSKLKKIGDFTFSDCYDLTSITIPSGVTNIPCYAFKGCYKLFSITISKNVTYIDEGAFAACTGLKKLTLPEKLGGIGRYAFDGCENLTDIVIPSGVTSISAGAFGVGKRFNRIYFKGNAPFIAENNYRDVGAFYGVTATAYYPKGNKTWTSSKRKNYGGKLTWKTWSPNQPKGVSLVSVTNQKGKKLKVTWKKNAAATGYEVQYSTSSKFKSAKKVKIKKASTTSTTISKLTKGKKYYVRIRTYKTVSGKTYYSGWSKVKTAVIKK